MKKKYFVLLLSVLFASALALAYLAFSILQDDKTASEERDFRPIFVTINPDAKTFDAEGNLIYSMKSKRSEYFKVSDLSSHESPFVIGYDAPSGIKTWEAEGNTGIFNTDEFLTLSGNAKVRGFGLDENGGKIVLKGTVSSEHLQLDVNSSDVSSTKLVTLTTPEGSHTEGLNFSGNLKDRKFTTKRDSHALIQPENYNSN